MINYSKTNLHLIDSQDKAESRFVDIEDKGTEKRARLLWNEYHSFCQQFDTSLQPFTERYFAERGNRPIFVSLNAVAPISFCHAFEVTNEQTVLEIGLAHLNFDHFTQVLDDLTDEEDSPPELLHLSHQLFMAGLSFYRRSLSQNHNAMREIEVHLEKVMKSERKLWACKNEGVFFNEDKFSELAGRGGIGKCIVIALGHLTDNQSKAEEFCAPLDSTAIGIQLCDDLLDWQTDFDEGTRTWPISCCIQNLLKRNIKPTKDTIAFEMIHFGIFEKVMNRASQELEIGAKGFAELGAVTLSNSLLGVRRSARLLMSNVDLLRASGSYDSHETLNKFEELISKWDVRMMH